MGRCKTGVRHFAETKRIVKHTGSHAGNVLREKVSNNEVRRIFKYTEDCEIIKIKGTREDASM